MAPMLAALILGCAPPDRGDWVREVLTRADAPFWGRPELLASKYRRMAADPYDFYRGSAALFYADVARPGARAETAFLDEPEASGVLLFGDPHPENLGTNRPEGAATDLASLRVEIVDLDAAGFGPWTLDLRRAAVGLALVRPSDAAEIVGGLAEGYADAILNEQVEPGERVIGRLRASTAEDGVERRRHAEVVFEGALRLALALDAEGKGLLALDAEDETRFARLSACLPPGGRVLDVARLYGKGVASMPAIRFLVLWDRGEEGDGDDDLLEVREIVDPSPIPGLWAPPGALFGSGADRIDAAGTALWGDAAADPNRRACTDGAQSFKALSGSSWFQGPEHVDLADASRWDAGDLRGFARDLGVVVGRGHSLSRGVIAADLDGRTDDLAAELSASADGDLEQLLADHEWFVDAVARQPLLGLGTLRREVP